MSMPSALFHPVFFAFSTKDRDNSIERERVEKIATLKIS